MASFLNALCCVTLISAIFSVNGDASFAGSSVTSDSSGTRSVLVTGGNGAGIQTRFGGGPPIANGPVGTYASAGGASASAGGASAYAGPGGAYAGGPYPGPWGFPYWNDGYASASAGAPYPYAYPPPPYPYPAHPDPYYYGNYNYGNGVYSGVDGNGIQTRVANVPPGGQATIVEQTGNEAPKVYTFRGPSTTSTKEVVAKIVS